MKEQEIYLPLSINNENEEEIALNAATEACVVFREYLEEKLEFSILDGMWAFAILMKFYPDLIEHNPHLLEDVKAILGRKNLFQQKVKSSVNN